MPQPCIVWTSRDVRATTEREPGHERWDRGVGVREVDGLRSQQSRSARRTARTLSATSRVNVDVTVWNVDASGGELRDVFGIGLIAGVPAAVGHDDDVVPGPPLRDRQGGDDSPGAALQERGDVKDPHRRSGYYTPTTASDRQPRRLTMRAPSSGGATTRR